MINRGLSPDDWENYDKIEQAIEAYLRRFKQKNNKKEGKGINAVLAEEEAGEASEEAT